MNFHEIFIDASRYDDDNTVMIVQCRCGEVMKEIVAYQPQVNLDEIVEMAWEHLDVQYP